MANDHRILASEASGHKHRFRKSAVGACRCSDCAGAPAPILRPMSPQEPDGSRRTTDRCGFVALLVTMSCGALNDNLLRGALLLSVAAGGMWGGGLGEGGTGWVTAMLYLPFIVLLGVTGQLADRFPKRTIIVWSRGAEIALAAGVTVGFWLQSLAVVCTFFVLLAAQSAFFSPAKYGSVPELVDDRDLSRANGLLSMLTNLAIILGVAAAGALLSFGPIIVGAAMIGIAVCGLVSSMQIPRRPAAAPMLRVSPRTVTAHFRVLSSMRGSPLLRITLAWCWFYAVGSLVITIVPAWREPLGLDDLSAGALLAAPGIGIGIGGVIAGLGSGDRIIAAFVPCGAAGMTLTFVLLGFMTPTFGTALALLVLCGLFAGFYVIPLLALLQHLPAPAFRARVVGTANFMTYVVMSVTAILFALIAPATTTDPEPWFLVCGGMMAVVCLV